MKDKAFVTQSTIIFSEVENVNYIYIEFTHYISVCI